VKVRIVLPKGIVRSKGTYMTTREQIIQRAQHPVGKRTGKRAPRIDPRTLQLRDYLKLPPVHAPFPPAEVSWIMEVSDWGMLANDTLGDCVPAAMLHMAQQWTHYAKNELVPSDSEAISLYSAIGGYVPGNPSTDNGCDMLTALNYWHNTGIQIGNAIHKIDGYVQVDPLNALEVQTSIQIFGNVFTGIALPVSAQTQTGWTVPNGGLVGDGSPGSWGGHCLPGMGRSPETVSFITWGARMKMSHNFFTGYVDELYAVLSLDWLESSGMSPSGLDLAQLQADIKVVGQ
jgi:hypothetical protein